MPACVRCYTVLPQTHLLSVRPRGQFGAGGTTSTTTRCVENIRLNTHPHRSPICMHVDVLVHRVYICVSRQIFSAPGDCGAVASVPTSLHPHRQTLKLKTGKLFTFRVVAVGRCLVPHAAHRLHFHFTEKCKSGSGAVWPSTLSFKRD